MPAIPQITLDAAVQLLVTETRLSRAFEGAREPGGSCTIEQKDLFLKLFMRSFARGTAHQLAKIPYARGLVMAGAQQRAADWFAAACTPF